MRFLAIWLAGVACGLPVGYIVRMFFTLRGRDSCRYVQEDMNAWLLTHRNCPGFISSSCVERLCPVHCKELHKDRCINQRFAATA